MQPAERICVLNERSCLSKARAALLSYSIPIPRAGGGEVRVDGWMATRRGVEQAALHPVRASIADGIHSRIVVV